MNWKRGRHRRSSSADNVWYVAGSCIVFFLLGNLLMFQTYHGFVENRGERSMHGDSLQDHPISIKDLTGKLLGRPLMIKYQLDQYSVFESRLRKLMENTQDSGRGDIFTHHLSTTETKFDKNGNRLLNCGDIDNITDKEYIASGWTKAVYKGIYKGSPVAVKTVDIRGQDVGSCVEQGRTVEDCYWKAAQKIINEIVILQGIPHDNIIKVIGFCVPKKDADKDGRTVVMVTELGETIDLIKLLQMSWEDRLRISHDVTNLMEFLANTPYGSVSMNDYRRQQFVLVNGQLKLSDVDDVGFDEPSCINDNECTVVFSSSNFTKHLSCIGGYCLGYNEHRNLFNTGRHFTTFLLPHGAPLLLKPHIEQVVNAYSNLTLNSGLLVDKMNTIVNLYKSGNYLNRTAPEQHKTEFLKHTRSDLPGQHDYRCRFSMSGVGCTVSVFDQREAEDICKIDPECKGFVITDQTTWAGRKIVHLKNGIGKISTNENTDLLIKPS
ncbi:hypothetical protein SNE40_009378 [Patella caerulea]|uniref:Protein kinase domain-containing protein n=1 Tax=Patella caerulea TaxID=87958 RepID=A0AAN8JNR4_PATCE